MSAASAETEDALQFSGFARVVLGYLDDSDSTYLGYENKLSLDQQSLIGLQADYQILDNLSVTGQFIGHTSDIRDSGVEWLYLTYKPTRSSQIKLGKQRTPLFSFSDSIDIGFAYPWITLPQEVYSEEFFSTFEGILANYEWSTKHFVIDIEGYWGSYDGSIYSADRDIPANVNDFRGLITKLTYNSWVFRASFHTANAFVEVEEFNQFGNALNQLGFTKSADSLNSNGKADFYQASASYENLDYFFRGEITKTRTEAPTIPDIDSYYVAAGYHYYPFLSYVSFAKSQGIFESPVNEIPIGLDPQLDALAYAFQSFSQFPFDSSKSFTIGTRWDWQANLALKAEITWTETFAGKGATFTPIGGAKFGQTMPLYQLALEWVF